MKLWVLLIVPFGLVVPKMEVKFAMFAYFIAGILLALIIALAISS